MKSPLNYLGGLGYLRKGPTSTPLTWGVNASVSGDTLTVSITDAEDGATATITVEEL